MYYYLVFIIYLLYFFQHEMFKGFQEGFRLINDDLETLFSNGFDSDCNNYNIKLALSDIHNLMTKYKNEEKNVSKRMLKN